MNKKILKTEVQSFIIKNVNADVHKMAMAKSPFKEVSSRELANQIAARKRSLKKLPTWFNTPLIYYPPLLSIEQCSSEVTANYKANLVKGTTMVDLTGGFGVDSLFFANNMTSVTHCEINEELSSIAKHNAQVFNKVNLVFKNEDGIGFLKETDHWGTIYIDPSRRSDVGKVFMLKDCLPNVIEHMNLMLAKAARIIIKTSPLLDITAALKELPEVSEVHIVSTKNECKELLFVIDKVPAKKIKIISSAINGPVKQFHFYKDDMAVSSADNNTELKKYLYEPDVALLKSGAFNLISDAYGLQKLNTDTQLYTADLINKEFPGRIFTIDQAISFGDMKKEKELTGSVIVRSFPQKAELLVKKYKIKPDADKFLIFTQYNLNTFIVIKATIIQHY